MTHAYGTWPSPIDAAMVAEQGLRLSAPSVDGDDLYWLEGRPDEGGRTVLVRRTPDGRVADVTPAPYYVRSRVHEYGGGAYAVSGGTAWFTHFTDQRIYELDAHTGGEPRPITPEDTGCYADLDVDRRRSRLIAVREQQQAVGEPVNTLVGIAMAGGHTTPVVLAEGYDFYSTPRLSPDGSRLAWLCWNHPQMPWDGTELWVADVGDDGRLEPPVLIAGGPGESIYQPGWSPDGHLYFVSDAGGWWRIKRMRDVVRPSVDEAASSDGEPAIEAVAHAPEDAEFGRPQWIFGSATWAFAAVDRLVVSYTHRGRWQLATVDVGSGRLTDVPTSLQPGEWLAATSTHAFFVGASADTADAVVRVHLDTGDVETLRATTAVPLEASAISRPDAIEFPTTGDRTAHAFYYPPRRAEIAGSAVRNPARDARESVPSTAGPVSPSHADAGGLPDEERPPLIVIGHGGPTAAARGTFDLRVQYWTTRGFAVVDVNYSGSSGFGRAYRERLNGTWGIADVDDMIHAARHLVAEGKADPARLIIRGGSAGGYTALAALAFHPEVFAVGASYYGVSDLEVLARDTHKFESRYLDTLVGPYPATRDTYRARSPIHHVERLACALILFQGLEDRVVPPNQSEMMADAVRRKGLPVAYLTFAGEQHGFRRAATIVRCLEAELAFYAAVFGLALDEPIDTVPIDTVPIDNPPARGSC